jgi:hypothetical protein
MANAVSRQVVPAVSKDRSDFISNTKQSQKGLRRCESSQIAHQHTVAPTRLQPRVTSLWEPKILQRPLVYSVQRYEPSTVSGHYYVPPSGHYMYPTVVTVCTVQWSLYVPPSGHYYVQPSGHYMYRTVVGHYMYPTVVTICTAQWSLYVPYSGHYMYLTVVTICTAQWSLYVPPV